MSLLIVDKTTCTQCGTCAAVCPPGIIYFKEKNYPRQLPGTDAVCIRCGHCVAVCPTGALFVGSPETVATKIAWAMRTLGLSRFQLKYA